MSGKNSTASTLSLRSQIPYAPWAYFGLFAISNNLVSYCPLSFNFKMWIVLFGVLLPFFLALWTLSEHSRSPFPTHFDSNPLPAPSRWLWLLLLLLLLMTRFYKLTAIPFWPISDEGVNASLALAQAGDWHWNLLWGEGRNEPFLFWMLGALFKVMTPSLLTIRLFTALFSIATSGMVYWASRQYFSQATSFFVCWLYSFSFGALVMSRMCHYFILLPFFLTLCFGLAGAFLKSKKSPVRWKYLMGLSLAGGAGFYTHTSWAVVWPILVLSLLMNRFSRTADGIKDSLFFVFFSVVIAMPIFMVRLSPTGMLHIHENFNSFFFEKYLALYGTAFLWNGLDSFPFGPVWGGYLNPLCSSLILIGVLHVFRRSPPPFLLAGFFCFFLSILPGILSNSIHLFRVVPLMVFLMVPAAWGLVSLYSRTGGVFSRNGIYLLLAVSLALNFYHYFARYCDPQLPLNGAAWRSVKYFQIYEALRKKSLQSGSLYVFSDFNMDYVNKTLEAASYPYNALENPVLAQDQPLWAALLVSMDDAPFLKKQFPRMENVPLDENVPLSLGLYLIPTSDFADSLLRSWIQADRDCRELAWQVINRDPVRPIGQVTEPFMPLEKDFAGDPFLSSVYWEKIAFFKSQTGDARGAAWAYQLAVQKGIPAPHLYYLLGKMSEITRGEDKTK